MSTPNGWLPVWLLKFIAGASLLGVLAWVNHTTNAIGESKAKAEAAASEAVALRAYAQETQRSLDRLERQFDRIEAKLDVRIEPTLRRTSP